MFGRHGPSGGLHGRQRSPPNIRSAAPRLATESGPSEYPMALSAAIALAAQQPGWQSPYWRPIDDFTWAEYRDRRRVFQGAV